MRPILHKHWCQRAKIGFLVFASLLALLAPALPAQAVANGDGMLFYSEQNTVSAPFREYTASGNSWTSPADLSTDTNGANYVRSAASPTESEMMVMGSNTNGQYRMHRWDGSAWTLEWTDTGGGSSGSTFLPRFDLAYDNAGNALAVYSTNATTSAELSYRTFTNATNTWSSEISLTAVRTNGAVRYVRVENRPGTDEFAIGWSEGNSDLSVNYYDLSANTFYGEYTSALSTGLAATLGVAQNRVFDLAFERSSGDLLVCWGNTADASMYCRPRSAGTGGSWGSLVTFTGGNVSAVDDIQMATDPDTSSNKIAWVVSDNTGRTEAGIWSGTAMGNYNYLDSTAGTFASGQTNSAVEWIRSGSSSQAVVIYDDTSASGIDWATFNTGTNTWTVQSDYTGAFAASSTGDGFHSLVRNPLNTAEMVALVVDVNEDISIKKLTYNGSSFTWSSMDSSGSLSTNQRVIDGWTASFSFFAYAPPPPVLSVDIVDAAGTTVASPSVAMSTITSGNTCQTTTGTLGTSSQKIRVTNTTATPGWTLSIAASGGTTSTWSAATSTYDFNDATSTGCLDGADADSVGGQLTVNASGGTRTPQSGCTNTGVTLGSSSAFVEGTTNSITILSASASAGTGCYWDLTSVSLSQKIPIYQEPGTYSLQLTLTVTAN